jgi:APA family basic amino acid/polyamine antiporter
LIGWDLSLEYLVAVSAVSRGFSGYISSIVVSFGGTMPNWLNNAGGLDLSPLSATLCLFMFSVVLFGAHASALVNLIVTALTVAVLLFEVICGSLFAHPDVNWSPFVPFGVGGIFSGAATLFFSYVGFDSIASVAEEAKSRRSVSLAIIVSVVFAMLLYCAVSIVFTMMVPLQNINVNSPIASAFASVGLQW